MLVEITGTKLVRDTENMALINKDINGLQEYHTKRKMAANQKEEINTIKSEINNIKNDMSEIKQLLFKLLEGTNG